MKRHPREQIVDLAELRIKEKLMEAIEFYDLTDLEEMRVLTSIYHSLMFGYIKYRLRYERHGNYETPYEEAGE